MTVPSRYYHYAPYPVTKTVTFDGAAGNGAVGHVDIFNITGQGVLAYLFATCSEDLVGAGNIVLEFSDGLDILPQTNVADLEAGDLWVDASPAEVAGAAIPATAKDIAFNGGAAGTQILLTVNGADITDGTLTIHALYYQTSRDGKLAAA